MRAGEGAHARPLDHGHRLVADRVPVVAGRNVVDVVRAELEDGAVAEVEPHAARCHDADVSCLAPVAADEGLHVCRPPPAGFLDGPGDCHARDLDKVLDDSGETDRLVGAGEGLRSARHEVTMTAHQPTVKEQVVALARRIR